VFNTRKQPATDKNNLAALQLSTPGQFERLLDSDEAAALLGIHKKTLQRMARSGEVPGVQIGDLWRFRASTLNEWLASRLAG
jgi:excisionase family DNA binding protein